MSHEKINPADLPDLPDSAELESLPELPDLPDLPELPDEPAPKASPAPPAPKPAVKKAPAKPAPKPKPVRKEPVEHAPAATQQESPSPAPVAEPAATAAPAPNLAADGERPPLRPLDKAPSHVLLAAKIVVAGAFLPFMVFTSEPGGNWWMSFVAKAIAIAAAWCWLQQVLHNFGPKKSGFIGTLAEIHLKPKPKEEEEGKKKRAKRGAPAKSIAHPFPTALHLVSLVLVGVALFVSTLDPRAGTLGPVGLTETALLAWAGFAFVHVRSYERWGSFNPLFPLMFLGMLFSGVASVLAGFGSSGMWMAFQVVGGLAVAGGGGLATYSIVEAMVEAKKEGDKKKAEELERRRAAREARRAKK
ncbi:MAG TPA: hypothetical protein ENJ09_16425 [Planctomycetes bacterium]|nr:hypothetical protein [Planctomycetota bacterium]